MKLSKRIGFLGPEFKDMANEAKQLESDSQMLVDLIELINHKVSEGKTVIMLLTLTQENEPLYVIYTGSSWSADDLRATGSSLREAIAAAIKQWKEKR